ncbi:hypothetical protein [Candidatus Pantoea edessiphila]
MKHYYLFYFKIDPKDIKITSNKFLITYFPKSKVEKKQIKKYLLNKKPENKSSIILLDKIKDNSFDNRKSFLIKRMKFTNDTKIDSCINMKCSLIPTTLSKKKDKIIKKTYHNNIDIKRLIDGNYNKNKKKSSSAFNLPYSNIAKNKKYWKYCSSAPMTKVPTPVWIPDPIRFSNWVRPPFHFNRKGPAGGHSATHKVAVPVTKP